MLSTASGAVHISVSRSPASLTLVPIKHPRKELTNEEPLKTLSFWKTLHRCFQEIFPPARIRGQLVLSVHASLLFR